MKSNVLKIVLPAFAILLAISLSFATESLELSQTGYYDDPFIPGIQSTTTNCTVTGTGDLCKVGIYQLYDTMDLEGELRQP